MVSADKLFRPPPGHEESGSRNNGPERGGNKNQPVKVRDVIKLIEADGWYFLRQRGSHRQYRHATKPGKVTIAGKPSEEMAPGTLGSIFRQAGIDQDEAREEE